MWLKSFKQNLPRLLEDRPDSSKRRELKWAKKQTLRNKFHLVKCSTKRLLIVGGDLHMLGTLPVMKEINHFGICFGKSKLQYYKPQEALNVHNNDISFFVMSEVKKNCNHCQKSHWVSNWMLAGHPSPTCSPGNSASFSNASNVLGQQTEDLVYVFVGVPRPQEVQCSDSKRRSCQPLTPENRIRWLFLFSRHVLSACILRWCISSGLSPGVCRIIGSRCLLIKGVLRW